MKVAKRFRWEAAHRLPWHEGECSNLHGHSYRMVVEMEGTPDARGILIDFKHIKHLLKPLVEAWDHALMIAESDTELLQIARTMGWKVAVLPGETTAENMASYVADYLCTEGATLLQSRRIRTVRVRIAETETCYAETARHVTTEGERDVGRGHPLEAGSRQALSRK